MAAVCHLEFSKEFFVMLFGFPVQTFTEIGQSAAELWSKNDYKMAFKEPSLDP